MHTYIKFTRRPTITHTLWLNVALFLLVTLNCSAQSPAYKDWQVFTIVEQPPEFPDGVLAMQNYLKQNVQYPSEAKKAGVVDRVFISFIVEPDGSITDIQVLKGVGYGCDEEAIRVAKAMPRWKPGRQSGYAERVKYNLPVLFGMEYPKPKNH